MQNAQNIFHRKLANNIHFDFVMLRCFFETENNISKFIILNSISN